MGIVIEFMKFLFYSALIVLIAKYILVITLRKLAESLKLKPRTVGNIAGYATSVPELLTIGASSFQGLIGTSIYNILSSNIINLVQYLFSVYKNKNQKVFQNQAIKVDLVMVVATILIPIVLIIYNIEINLAIVPIFIILYALFNFLNNNAHKVYLKIEDEKLAKEIEEDEKRESGKAKVLLYIFYLIITGILLFIIGNQLGTVLENLCLTFNIPQFVIGILLGVITSIPELITFFEAQKHYKNSKKDDILGVVEATNNLLTSNILNLFLIQSIGILIFVIFK